MMLPNIIFGGR